MDLLGHWVCENCDSVDPPTFKGDEKACGICADEGENGLLIELVPASRLRGAVEVRDAAADLLRVLDKYDAEPVVAINAIDRLRAAITAAGGAVNASGARLRRRGGRRAEDALEGAIRERINGG